MPSSLTGLIRTLAWTDFPRRQVSAPGPGQTATAARTHASFGVTGLTMLPVPGARPPQFRLADSVAVRVTFNRNQSFVSSWLFGRAQQFQTDMLNHEQGHYNITALVSRDFFIDIMLLKAQTFANRQAGLAAVRKIEQGSVDRIQAIQQLYDREVHPEQNSGQSRGPIQRAWDGFIQTAFTTSRSAGTQAPDGTFHKVRLIDVLTTGGKHV